MYIHIVSPKVHVSTTFTIFIYFCDISKRKNERKWFFFFLKNLSTFGVCMQKYPMSTITQKVFGMGTTPFLEYPCFIALLYWNFDGKPTFHLNCWFKTLNILKKCLKSYFFIRGRNEKSDMKEWLRWKAVYHAILFGILVLLFNCLKSNRTKWSNWSRTIFQPLMHKGRTKPL